MIRKGNPIIASDSKELETPSHHSSAVAAFASCPFYIPYLAPQIHPVQKGFAISALLCSTSSVPKVLYTQYPHDHAHRLRTLRSALDQHQATLPSPFPSGTRDGQDDASRPLRASNGHLESPGPLPFLLLRLLHSAFSHCLCRCCLIYRLGWCWTGGFTRQC